jgi:VanZ family protein
MNVPLAPATAALSNTRVWRTISVLGLALSLWLFLMPPGADDPNWRSFLDFFTENDKVVHGMAFAVFGCWFGALAARRSWWKVAVMLFLYAILIELLQAALPTGRSGDWRDVLADVAGMIPGLLAANWFGRRWLQQFDVWLGARVA